MYAALESLLASPNEWDDRSVAELVQPFTASIPDLQQQVVNLSLYDQLLSQEVGYVSA